MSLTENFDKRNKDNSGKKDAPEKSQTEKEIENYDTAANVRNVCFVQPDGKELVLYYTDIMSQRYDPADNIITLTFRTYEVTLKGRNLGDLFLSFKAHVPKRIVCVEKRYEATKDETGIVVTEIIIQAAS